MQTLNSMEVPEEMVNFNMQDVLVNLLNSLSTIKDLSEINCQVEDEKNLIKQALSTLIQKQDMERCSFFRLDSDGMLTNVTGLSIDEDAEILGQAEKPLQFQIGEGIIGAAAATEQTQHSQNCREDSRFAAVGKNLQLPGSIISVPVFTLNHTLIGILNISHPEPYYFSDWHLRLLDIYKNMLGQLITNHRLFQEMETLIASRTIELKRLVEETRQLKDHYANISVQDHMTGLHNRRYFYDQAEIVLAHHNRYQYPFCLLVLDIDHFKSINDRYGHAFGDEVLIQVAKTLRQQVRNTDVLVRFGGEEFVVIFTNTTCDNGHAFAERIRTAIKSLSWELSGATIQITISIGLNYIQFHPQETGGTPEIDEIIHCADLALYAAKSEGRDRVVMFEEKMRK